MKYVTLTIIALLLVSFGINLYLLTSGEGTRTVTEYVTLQSPMTTTITSTVTRTVASTLTITTQVARFEESPYPLKIVDFMNREVLIAEQPKRVISCAPSNTEILASLGLLEYIVGVDEFSDYPLEVRRLRDEGKIANIGGFATLNIEKILELKPDIVFLSGSFQARLVPVLEEKGVTVVVLDANSILDVYKGIILVGMIMNVEDEAFKLVNSIRERIDRVQLKLAGLQYKKSVTGIIWLEPIWTAGNNTYLNDIIALAGGYNSLIDSTGWFMTSPETIVTRNPEVVFITAMSIGLKPEEVFEKFKNIEGMASVNAVKDDEIYLLYGQAENIFVRPGPRVGEAVELLSKILYPEIFKVDIPKVLGDDYREHLSSTLYESSPSVIQ
ncbi:MAG: ABC transporter substrate-binding protein [Candidatus Caldarchaeales archaeon]